MRPDKFVMEMFHAQLKATAKRRLSPKIIAVMHTSVEIELASAYRFDGVVHH
ncbi:hypothetical protein [Mesorhizobium amorphae]|uniref:hypothetical protein n=1 Tax=Mesorhizobium amorphae TaxID=71433 RepID=UPI0017807849|nr:hypothetical protein [Mesorhizobium amorphae]